LTRRRRWRRRQLAALFERRGLPNVKLRLLTDRHTGRPRGIGFAEFSSDRDTARALAMDHSLCGGRRIRVERTAGGGGKQPRRAGRIVRARGQQAASRRAEVLAYLNRTMERAEARRVAARHAGDLAADGRLHASRLPPAGGGGGGGGGGGLRREDVDERVMEFLCTLPRDVMRSAVRGCARADLGTAESRPAYLMGLIKRRLRRRERRAKRLRRAASRGRAGEGAAAADGGGGAAPQAGAALDGSGP
jgi:hypothetical protein